MGRSSNDDRSDSMNPNNDAYSASEENHRNQTGRNDDDDELIQSHPLFSSTPSHYQAPQQKEPTVKETNLSVVISSVPKGIGNVFLYLVQQNQTEKKIKVDTTDLDTAINEARVLWDSGAFAFLALYGKDHTYFEKSNVSEFPCDISNKLSYIGDMEELIKIADKYLKSARIPLDKCLGQSENHNMAMCIKEFGSWKAAGDALRYERNQRLQEIRKQGFKISEESIQEAVLAAKIALKVTVCAKWICDFQQGKIQSDPLMDAFQMREKICDIKIKKL